MRSSRRTAIADDPRLKARRRTLFIRLGAVAVVLLAGGVGYKTYQKKIDQALESKAAKKQRKIDHEQALFQEGKNLVRQGKWTEAKAKFEEVLASGPENPKDVQTYLTRAETEIPNQEHFTAGMAAIEAGQIAVAFKELGLVSNDTLQTEQRDKLRAAIEKKIESKLGDVRLLLGSTSDRAKMVQLKELAEDVLAARPENRDATDYKKTAEKAIDAIDHPYVAPKEAPKPWLHVQDVYRGGDVTGAYSEAQRCEKESNQCKQLAGQIRDMNEKYKRLESMGPGELSSLLDLDHKITGGPSSEIGRRIGTRANASYIKTASSAKATGNWARAAEYAKKVLSNDPNNVEAQSIMNECNNHAREIYMRAYSIKDSDPDEAVKLFKQVVEMTPPDSEYNTKAKARLSRNTSD